MRSSVSTPSPPRSPGVRLYLLVEGDDHPKACTGRRLLHLGRVRGVPRIDAVRPRPIVLDPYARVPLAPSDLGLAQEAGVLAVDCSWNGLAARGSFPSAERPRGSREGARRLPLLIAANPHHYGRLGELNTVEALAAALAVFGAAEDAARLFDGFRGGDHFLEINRERLARYARAPDAVSVLEAERALFGGA